MTTDLLITDRNIYVDDATKLPLPDRELGVPGIVFINGEKISYYRNYSLETVTPWTSNAVIDVDTVMSFNSNYYLTTGNTFAVSIPWEANTVFASNAYFYYSGNSYQATGNVNAPLFADIEANTALLYNNEDSGFSTIVDNIELIGNTVSVLSQLRRGVDGTAPNSLNILPWTTNTSIPTGSYISYSGNTYVTTGNTFGFNDVWRANVIFATSSFFSYGGNVYQSTGNVYAPPGGQFSTVISNTALIYTNRIDSGFASIEDNINLLYSGTDNLRHLSGERVVDSSKQQAIPDYVVSDVNVSVTTDYTTTANVTFTLRMNGNITANIGDFIKTTSANVRLLENATTASNVAVIKIGGNIQTATGETISIVNRLNGNITVTAANVIYATVTGKVANNGNVTVSGGTTVINGNIWYGNASARAYGDTMSNSTTVEAEFLKAEPGYIP